MKTTICLMIKNEHQYLEEWIDYHLNLGFSDIHIFEDKGSDSHSEITSKFENVILHSPDDGDVKYIFSSKGHRQLQLYLWFLENYKDKYDWIAIVDVDEFITLSDNYSLEKFFVEFDKYPAVLINWKMFGANGHIKRPKGKTIEVYSKTHKLLKGEEGYAFKSFINTKNYKGLYDLHRAIGFVTTNHSEDCLELNYDKIWINHYFTKSWEDWLYRILERGGTVNGHRTLDQFFECNPDMEHLREELINEQLTKKPIGSMWIDRAKKIMVGGNLHIINELNKNK